MKRTIAVAALAALMIAATPEGFGGWAVVTFHDFPEFLEVGQPTTLTFRIRQHGETLRTDVSPSLQLRESEAGLIARLFKRNRAPARLAAHGTYQATVTPESEGMFSLIVDTDVHGWTTRTLPIRVVNSGGERPTLSLYHRGQQLFVAAGCATCHAKRDDPSLTDIRVIQVGPALTGRTFDPEWLASKLADPANYRMTVVPGVEMPDLELRESEIAALVQYVNRSGTPAVTSSSGT